MEVIFDSSDSEIEIQVSKLKLNPSEISNCEVIFDSESEMEFELSFETKEDVIISNISKDILKVFFVIKKYLEVNKPSEKTNNYISKYLTQVNVDCITLQIFRNMKYQYEYIKTYNKIKNYNYYEYICCMNDIIRIIEYNIMIFDLVPGLNKQKLLLSITSHF